ncbi:MAG: PLDc N-terminal domain-containing protein [Lacisediminihabitans sp.]
MYVLSSLLILVLFVGALVDIIMRDQSLVRHLPKLVWILLVILLPVVGSILWFALGREYSRPIDRGGFGDPRRRTHEPVQQPQVAGTFGVRDTEAELAALNREIVANEKADRIRRLEAELQARRAIGDSPK